MRDVCYVTQVKNLGIISSSHVTIAVICGKLWWEDCRYCWLEIGRESWIRWSPSPPPQHQRLLTRLAWQATMYWLWNERSTRLHASTFRSVDQVFKLMDMQLINKIQSFRDTNPTRSSTMMLSWIRFQWTPTSPLQKLQRFVSDSTMWASFGS